MKIPILSCAEAKAFEKRFFDPARADGTEAVPQEADFMRRAGIGIGEIAVEKLRHRAPTHVLALVGKGHNGGDALIATETILRAFENAKIKLALAVFAEDWDELAPLTMDAYESLLRFREKPPVFFAGKNFSVEDFENFLAENFPQNAPRRVVLDGIYGHGFRPPLRENVFRALVSANAAARGSLRIAIDLPSGVSDSAFAPNCAFVADYTCAAGIVKTPLLAERNSRFVGRVVPVKIGFPAEDFRDYAADTKSVLENLPLARPVFCDKRSFGHLAIVGGSRSMPGALMLNTLAALRAGAGLVSVICPESVHAAFAARAPAAMWIPCREDENGSLDAEDAFEKLRKFFPRANTILCGSGMGDSENSRQLCTKIASKTPEKIALVLDADALRPETISALSSRGNAAQNILLPHLGEFLRMGGEPGNENAFCEKNRVAIALKGAYTKVCNAHESATTFAGTPALARGGSGDLLAGMVGALFASREGEFEKTAFAGDALQILLAAVIWHGTAAERLASAQGIRTADISALPEFF